MTPQPGTDAPTSTDYTTAVELARLTGRVEQMMNDHERRINSLEQRRDGGIARFSQITAPVVSVVALLVVFAEKIQWA